MSTTLVDDALRLPPPERLELVERLWDSLCADESVLILSDEQRAELDHRLDDLEKNPDAGRPWSVVRAELLSRHR